MGKSNDLTALFDRFRGGDSGAFSPFFHACRAELRRRLRRVMPKSLFSSFSEDAIQIALIRLADDKPSFADDARLIAWTETAARNAATSAYRRRRPAAQVCHHELSPY